jgi:enamine deaminase RidA (YjgF/YER057c/UK114 family)
MFKALDPKTIHPPFARYAHGLEVPAGARLAVCSGQLGIARDAQVPDDVAGQADLCFQAVVAILAEAGMTLADVVRINAYVSAREHLSDYMRVRDRWMVGPPCASTLMIVSGFSRPEFKVEIEALAAKVD